MQTRREILSVFRNSKYSFAAAGIFSLFINLLMLTGPLFMLQIYDSVLVSGSVSTLLVLFILVTGLYVILGLLELIRSRVLVRIGINLDHRIGGSVFSAVMRQSLDPVRGGLVASALNELALLRQFIVGSGPAALFDAPWVPIYLAVIFIFHWTLGVLALCGAIALFVIALLAELLVRKPMAQAAVDESKSQRLNEAGRRNAEVLAALGMVQRFKLLWEKDHENALASHVVVSDRSGTLSAISKSLRLFLQSAMLALGAWLAIQQIISPGAMIAASIILGRALQPVEQAISQWRAFVRARHAYHRINSLLYNTPTPAKRMKLPSPKGHLSVRGLHISVPGQKQLIVENVNFEVEPGQILAIIGPSGSGKSTLARVLVDVWPKTAGEVRLDDSTFDQWNREDLGNHIGYLPQDVELFEGTVKQNIARFQSDPDENDIIKATEMTGIHKMILGLPHGYDTQIGPGGANLSAGQRQRIAMARAVYCRPVLIVLDEPNSNLDNQGDAEMVQTLLRLRAQKCTIIIIAHRLSILEAVDNVLILENGKQQAYGPRDEILVRPQKNKRPNVAVDMNFQFKKKLIKGPG